MGCLSQTANENRFASFLNNRNITPVTADIRKDEEKLILLFTLHQIAGNALYKGDSRGEEWVKRGEELRKTLHPPQPLYIKGIRAIG